MRNQKIIFGLIPLIIISLIFGILRFAQDDKKMIQQNAQAVVTYPDGTIDLVDVADSPRERNQGLSDRVEPQSMLFLFDERASHTFWMKGMQFALDFIWLDQGKIIGITKNAQPENPPRTFYSAPVPVRTVLEVPSGTVEKLDLKIGDKLDIEWNPE